MAIKDKVTTKGGNRGYRMVRSKIAKGKDGYGRMISQEREEMLQKLGRDPGPNVVAMHKEFGSHHSPLIEKWKKGTRGENTAESNKHRAKIRFQDKVKARKKK